ncbi:MAG TPA: DUF6232 family protein [Chloroflexia bacterium]|jgi:hypothetical protein
MAGQAESSAGAAAGATPETVLYHAADVWLSDTRVVFGGRSYQLKDIQPPEVVAVPPERRFRASIPFIPPVILYMALLWFGNFDNTFFAPVMRALPVIALAGLLWSVVTFLVRLRKTRYATYYSIHLTGKAYAYTSTDSEYINWLARQIARVKEGAHDIEAPPDSAHTEAGLGEYVYYSDGLAAVTSKWVIMGGERIELQSIKKAVAFPVSSDTFTRRQALALTFLFLSMIFTNIRSNTPDSGRDFILLSPGGVSTISLLLAVAGAGMLLRALSSAGGSAYLVRLSGQFGELMLVETFATFDQAYAKTLTDHINNAVRARKSGIFAGNAATSS